MNMVEEHIRFLQEECETGFVTDALMLLGVTEGCWMDNRHPFKRGDRFVGQAFTTRMELVDGESGTVKGYSPYDIMAQCPKGAIWVIGETGEYCMWGGNAYLCAYHAGVGAMVVEGKCRDYKQLVDGPMPIFAGGVAVKRKPAALKFTEIEVPIVCDGAKVRPGDIVIGDDDGVVVIPLELLDDVMVQVKMIKEIDERTLAAINEGRSPAEEKAIKEIKSNRH